MVARVPFGSLFNFASKSGSVSNLADRKSTRLNSSHDQISYAVFCLKSKEHTSELQSRSDLVCRLLLEKKKPRERWELDPWPAPPVLEAHSLRGRVSPVRECHGTDPPLAMVREWARYELPA